MPTLVLALLGCGQPLDGFGTVGDAWLTVAESAEGEWYAFGFVQAAAPSCSAPSTGSGGSGGSDASFCAFMLEVAEGADGGASINSNRFDQVSFSFSSVASEEELWASSASVVEDAPCYGADPEAGTFTPIDATLTLTEHGDTPVLTFSGELQGETTATLCR